MAEVDAKPRASAQFGCAAGLALLLFAGALVATAQFGVEAPGYARRLQVATAGVPAFSVAVGASSATAAPFTGVAALPVAGVVAAPPVVVAAPPVVVAAKEAPVLNCAENAYLEVEAATGAVSLTVKQAHDFIVGQKLAIDVGTAQEEEHFIAAAGPGRSITLRKPLVYTHVAGGKVCIQKLSLHQQFRHQFSSGSLDSLKSSDSSTGSISQSSDSLTGLEFGSSADNLPKAGAASSGAAFVGSWAFNLIIMLCYACCYKSKVVDSLLLTGSMPPKPQQHDWDDFRYGVCECWKDMHMCCMVTCCPFIRMAHTNAMTNVCGFWNTLICLGCASLCPLGPCCLQVYFRIHIKDHMGIKDHCFNDMVLAACCLPCITGQQALSADEAMGVRFRCPCTLESASSTWGAGAGFQGYSDPEQQRFSYS